MTFCGTLIVIHVVVTVCAMVVTYTERRRRGQRSFPFDPIGYVACTA